MWNHWQLEGNHLLSLPFMRNVFSSALAKAEIAGNLVIFFFTMVLNYLRKIFVLLFYIY